MTPDLKESASTENAERIFTRVPMNLTRRHADMLPLTEDGPLTSKREKWVRWLEEIKQQVYSAMESRLIYRETSEIIQANITLPKESAFYGRLQLWYAESALMAVRRQAKIDSQAISLARLMREIQQSPELINREYWVSLFKGYVIEDLADGMFDRIAGVGAAHIDPIGVEKDLADLRQLVATCETWADKRVAHFDTGHAPKPPTYQELDDALDVIGRMLQKYHNMVTADAIAYTTPQILHNWKRVFEHAWLPKRHRD
jgi:hypothetical protein